MHRNLLSRACQLYNTKPDLIIPLSGGHYNAVYEFPLDDQRAILRIGVEDCPPEQTLAMLEWVKYLDESGAPVSAPICSTEHRLMEQIVYEGSRYTLTAFEKVEGSLAEDISPHAWTNNLFRSIGAAVGRLHNVSMRYLPADRSYTRSAWNEASEVKRAIKILSTCESPAGAKLASLMDELQQLPTDRADFGLIHGDLHFANFLIKPNGKVTIIDFDDCVYGWYALDVAMALFDVLVLYDPQDEEDSRRFARQFLSNYLAGYWQEKSLSTDMQRQIPHMLKLKELCIYASLIGHPDIDKPDTWVGRFMRNRVDRIAANLPYVDIDFGEFSN